MNWLWDEYCKIKLFIGAILHVVSNKPELYLESSETSMRQPFSSSKTFIVDV